MNIPISSIKAFNNLDNEVLFEGQKLFIPNLATNYNIYLVKSGDTLHNIANKSNTTAKKIKELNNLKNNLIHVNDKLKLPI